MLRSRRFRRYAIVSAVQLAVFVAVAVMRADGTIALALGVAVSLPALWAWGQVHADIALNPDLDEAERVRWRIGLACVPGAIAAYWFLYVR
jgi:hypothetical protein